MQLDPISNMNGYMRMYLASALVSTGTVRATHWRCSGPRRSRLPITYAVLAALHGHLGQTDQAQEALAHFESQSIGTIEEVARIWFPRPGERKLFLDGIALAEGNQAAGLAGD